MILLFDILIRSILKVNVIQSKRIEKEKRAKAKGREKITSNLFSTSAFNNEHKGKTIALNNT